jgi:glycosyltransferase involved in cell wall biosynthesis
MLVSVIIAVFNGEATLGETLESAVLQTYKDLEIIVVDDGSTDGTPAIIQSYSARDSRIRAIRQTNGGVARARNRGIAEARGEFIAPLDADDLWDPAKLERQIARMQDAGDGTGFVYCWSVRIDAAGAVVDRLPEWFVEGDTLATLVQANYTGNASTPLYRKRCVVEAGGYDERPRGCEDWDLALKVAARHQVAAVPELLVGYRRSPTAMSLNFEMMERSRKQLIDGVRDREPGLPPAVFRRSEEQFALYIAGMLFWSGRYGAAIVRLLRCWNSPLAWRALPYIVGGVGRGRRRSQRAIMKPGVPLDPAQIPQPLIPYNRL